MKYIVTGVDGKLAGRVAETMLQQVEGSELIFTCPNPDRVPEEKKERWNQAGVALRAASYDDEEQMTAAFSGGERLFFISSILNGERRVRQHRSVIEACKKAGIGHITYTSFHVYLFLWCQPGGLSGGTAHSQDHRRRFLPFAGAVLQQ